MHKKECLLPPSPPCKKHRLTLATTALMRTGHGQAAFEKLPAWATFQELCGYYFLAVLFPQMNNSKQNIDKGPRDLLRQALSRHSLWTWRQRFRGKYITMLPC